MTEPVSAPEAIDDLATVDRLAVRYESPFSSGKTFISYAIKTLRARIIEEIVARVDEHRARGDTSISLVEVRPSPPRCGAVYAPSEIEEIRLWVCTLPTDHDGPHEDSRSPVEAVWPRGQVDCG